MAVSVYKDDNSSILDALLRMKGRARAVVSIDPAKISDSELEMLHEAGARGVRINLKTWGKSMTQEQLAERLERYARKIRRLGWLIQMYIALEQVQLLRDVVGQLGVPIVLDHMASPDPFTPAHQQKGYLDLLDLLRQDLIWIKISGTYRFSQLPDLDEYGKTLIQTNPNRVVWASDWPHTGGVESNPNGNRHQHQDYRDVDDLQFVRRCFAWCHEDQSLIHKLFAENPRKLWTAADRPHSRPTVISLKTSGSISESEIFKYGIRDTRPVRVEGLQA